MEPAYKRQAPMRQLRVAHGAQNPAEFLWHLAKYCSVALKQPPSTKSPTARAPPSRTRLLQAEENRILDSAAATAVVDRARACKQARLRGREPEASDDIALSGTFPKALFCKRAPPGPTCLMRLLRIRLGLTEEQDYNYEAATSDFKPMTEQVKTKTRDKENTWTCCLCDVSYPCEAFGAQASSAEDVYSKCVLPGCWIKCIACTSVLECRYKTQT